MIVTRFAPSPTGHLHIGGARTALFSFLHAKHNEGKFLLRMEDTDIARSKPEYAESIMKDLKWLGINWDNEEIPFQSKRLAIYKPFIESLIKRNLAYEEEGAIYLRGNDDLGSFVIVKSDGIPTFHFAVVIDDHLMGVNVVIRGLDHLTNTEKHLYLYKCLGITPPKYFHIPLIVDDDNQPLSKRREDSGIAYYQNHNYFPEAIVNYLARLGWGYQNQEIFSFEELIKLFEINKVSKNPAKLDSKKLNWMNSQYLRKADCDSLFSYGYVNINKLIASIKDNHYEIGLLQALQLKAFNLIELDGLCLPFTNAFAVKKPEDAEINNFISTNGAKLIQIISNIESWNLANIELVIQKYIKDNNIELKNIAKALRKVLTNEDKSLDLYSLIYFLGKINFEQRIKAQA